MLLGTLREEVLAANLELVRRGVVVFTFGNVSGISRKDGLVAIKPSGVPYDELTAEQIVVCDIDGRIVDSNLRPSSDLPTHLQLYRHFPRIGGVAHTHSEYATSWAQAKRPIPCLGTTHADYFHGPIPVTPDLTDDEIGGDYEQATGVAIVRTFVDLGLDPDHHPGVMVAGHAPFCWGMNAADAVHNAAIVEYIARMATHTLAIDANSGPLASALHDKHFFRKHGPSAYYGQDKERLTKNR
jgi:L-ribulose-5-phosphate 4-epimerase